jgi:hypothetical protein
VIALGGGLSPVVWLALWVNPSAALGINDRVLVVDGRLIDGGVWLRRRTRAAGKALVSIGDLLHGRFACFFAGHHFS